MIEMGGAIRAARPLIEICAELDAAEGAAWDRLGGPSEHDDKVIRALERKIEGRRADSAEAAMWRAKRLVRAVVNGWSEREIQALATAADRDLGAMAI